MDARKLAGREAEARCAEYLRERGYRILAMNYACRGGEIDIVAAKGAYLAFVEVKERANRRFGEAREAAYDGLRRGNVFFQPPGAVVLHSPTPIQKRFLYS